MQHTGGRDSQSLGPAHTVPPNHRVPSFLAFRFYQLCLGMMAEVLSRHPAARALLLKRAAVTQAASRSLAAAGVLDRCDVVAGDFFAAVPEGGWHDDQARPILRCCRMAMQPAARLLIAEFVLPETDGPSHAKWVDLLMLAYVGGRERTQAEYADLLASAGFALDRAIVTNAVIGLLEARPV